MNRQRTRKKISVALFIKTVFASSVLFFQACDLVPNGILNFNTYNSPNPIPINSPLPLQLISNVQTVSIGNFATLSATGGQPPYTFSASGGVLNGNQFSAAISGIYTLTVKDSVTTQSIPIDVKSAISIFAGGDDTCATLNTGETQCFGYDQDQNFQNQPDNYFSPVTLTSILGIGLTGMSGANSLNQFECFLISGGVYCSGENSDGELGNGTTNSGRLVQAIGLSSDVIQIVSGDSHSCALLSSSVWCWGANQLDQIGNGSTTMSQPVPLEAMGFPTQFIAAKHNNSCADVAGTVWCWGDDSGGQIGLGTATASVSASESVGFGSSVTSIAISNEVICAVNSGGVLCAGTGSELLGNGQTQNLTPEAVTGFGVGSGVQSIVSNDNSFCVLKSDGSVWCWGIGSDGELGVSGLTQSPTPVQVTGLDSGVTQIVAGENHTCALKSDGSVWCWGLGIHGQLGQGSSANSDTPILPESWQ